tara:strand:+ start:4169 stop:4723 length:555 start_codon:yes stop_codon:yes gene_type:complete
MIFVQDNFFAEKTFIALQKYAKNNPFNIQKAGKKEFSVLQTPDDIIPILNINGHKLVFTFIRKAYKGFDNELRIHADNIINGHKTALASVLYINENEGVTVNGTAFYRHKKYGNKLPEDVTDVEFDRIIREDSNDPLKWEDEKDSISSRPNRRVLYDSNYFHSKFPNEIKEGERIVLVNFYAKE